MNYCKCGNPLPRGHVNRPCRSCLVDEIRLRLKQGLNQSEVARQMGYTNQHISKLLKHGREKRGGEDELL